MAATKAAWGMEIGADGIKAIRLEREGEQVTVADFAVIPHKKVLTTPDLDQDEMIRLSLGQFISQKSLEGEHLVMSVPGHAAFARFAKLPPVEPKKVPDIVKFEAVQQIPFPIDEVEWDYQTFTSDDSPEIEVGIFAITRDRVQQRLGLYGELGISPESLTLSPVAVYNAMAYDLELAGSSEPVVFLDIGTQATDVVIADEGRCWIRTFPLGGTHFTEAIANAFKLSYSKAEKLKREASSSKYAKQIMQAMRPVFSDLLQDLQRSIGYYQSLHRENDLNTMVGIGSTFKIPGLRKFIGQQLQINVVRLDEYKRITVTGREAASFAENTVNMATAYGLALQGVGLAPIAANLVPVKALREQMWHAKTKWFAAAAAIIVVGAATTLYHPLTDRGLLEPTVPAKVTGTLDRGKTLRDEFQAAQAQADIGFAAENMRRMTDYRRLWPYLVNDVSEAIASANPQPSLLGDSIEDILGVPAAQRRLVQLEALDGTYQAPLDPKEPRLIEVTMQVELSHENPILFLNESVAEWLRENAEPTGARADAPYRIIADSVSCNPAMLSTIEVGEDGEERAGGGSGDASSRRPRDRGTPSRPGGNARPPVAPRKPPGAREPAGESPAPPSAAGAPAGGMSGRRKAPVKTRKPPGARGPGSGGLGGVGTPSGTPAGQPGTGGTPTGTGPRAPREQPAGPGNEDLENLAPMPVRPALYKPKAKFYVVPITFQVEILDPGQTEVQDRSAAREAGEGRRHG